MSGISYAVDSAVWLAVFTAMVFSAISELFAGVAGDDPLLRNTRTTVAVAFVPMCIIRILSTREPAGAADAGAVATKDVVPVPSNAVFAVVRDCGVKLLAGTDAKDGVLDIMYYPKL